MKNEIKKQIVEGLETVRAGVAKIAELSKETSKKASAPSEELQSAATDVATKLAGLGLGDESAVAGNAQVLASDHLKTLRGVSQALDMLSAQSSKEASGPSGLGEPAGKPSASLPPSQQAFRPIRC
jgi:hypothetical protein